MLTFLLAALLMTPDLALQKLMEGNDRSASDDLLHPNQTIERRQAIIAKQKPFAVIVGCSDSRVPPEIIFDQGLGDLFIVRVAGNVVGPVELDSIEYAVKYLGASLVLVMGHQDCGAIGAILEGKTQEIEDVANLIEPALKGKKKLSVDAAVKANVIHVVDYLKSLGDKSCIGYLAKDGKVKVVGGYYDLASGKVAIITK